MIISLRNILGAILISLPFVALFVGMTVEMGIVATLQLHGGIVVVFAIMAVGAGLLNADQS